MELNKIKIDYANMAKKYSLPDFKELNEQFEVEKLEHESETILRAFRKIMMEKIINILGFLEMFINPVNVPRMYMPYIKSMNVEDKKDIDKMYEDFSNLSLEALDLEVDYSEKGEAEMINKVFAKWASIKPEFRRILVNMKKPVENNVGRERSYYG